MEANYNVTGDERKALVKAIETILQQKAIYKKTPSFAYVVGDFTVGKEGTVSCQDADALERLVHNLIADGFRPAENQEPEVPEEHEEEEEDEEMSISISMPTAMFDEAAMTNLKRLVESKSELMKRAFKTSELPIEEGEDRVTFPWFQADANPEEIRAYTLFIQKLCEMAIRQKRINQTKKEIVNEKYEFRCFLLRLGLIGDEFKTERKILMRHLTGSAAFKRG